MKIIANANLNYKPIALRLIVFVVLVNQYNALCL